LPGLSLSVAESLQSCAAIGSQIEVVERIFEDAVSLVVLQRPIQPEIARYLACISRELHCGETRRCVSLEQPDAARLFAGFPEGIGRDALIEDYEWILGLFATVADTESIGVRLASTLERSCPRFHVDHVPLRLICTWQGPATEWLEHVDVDRRFLGRNHGGKPDELSGLLRPAAAVQQMAAFDIGLMKGEGWPGNEGAGLVHRSPMPRALARVMITLDALA